MSETKDTMTRKVKKPKGRPRNVEGEYASKLPKDPEYFKKYYRNNKSSEVIQCESILFLKKILRIHAACDASIVTFLLENK